jgi:predicted small secreted protein
MSEMKKLSAMALATAAAALIVTGCATSGGMGQASKSEGTVHCAGVNSCKGQTSCKSAKNDCKGKNSCKGQGWLPMTKDECMEKGGTVM